MVNKALFRTAEPRAAWVARIARVAGLSVSMDVALAGCRSETLTTNEATNEVTNEVTNPTIAAEPNGAVLELRFGTNDSADGPAAFAMIEYARQVAELSGGSIIVELVWRAAGDPAPDDWEQAVAAEVIGGRLDLGLIATAAWDTEQVTSLRVLNAPFLVDSEELVAAIVSGDLAGDLMAGLDDAGVTGVALVPEGLRYVFAYGEPLTSPEDFVGVTIRSPRSDTVYSLFQNLGATAEDPQSAESDEQAADGTLAGVESSFVRATGLPGGATAAVGNLTLFPKVNAVVVNQATFASLTATQQAVLSDAVARMRDVLLTGSLTDRTVRRRGRHRGASAG